MSKLKYDCLKCPAYCCSYEHIPVTDKALKRLAKYFGLSPDQAKKRHTKRGDKETPMVLRQQADEHYETICKFIDIETRNCTIYEARPAICRDFPTQKRCGYYEFLKFEREVQEDEEWVATTS